MHIKECESIVGLSSKNIRYYEEVGLISPTRNSQNDYRVYGEDDIKKLKIIKFLRELNVPIREIKLLFDKKITLADCMNDRIKKIEDEEVHYKKTKNMCNEIIKRNNSIDDLDIQEYFLEMNILNKEGFTMRDVKNSDFKKICGAVISSFIFSIFEIAFIIIISYFQFSEADKMPWIMYFILIFILGIPVLGIGYNLIVRIKEIKGGEENEASKY